MNIKPVRVGFLFYALLALVALGSLFACGRVPDPRADLIRSLKGADVQGCLCSPERGGGPDNVSANKQRYRESYHAWQRAIPVWSSGMHVSRTKKLTQARFISRRSRSRMAH